MTAPTRSQTVIFTRRVRDMMRAAPQTCALGATLGEAVAPINRWKRR
jgi:hypothetical protein